MRDTGGFAAKEAMALALKIESIQFDGVFGLCPFAMPE